MGAVENTGFIAGPRRPDMAPMLKTVSIFIFFVFIFVLFRGASGNMSRFRCLAEWDTSSVLSLYFLLFIFVDLRRQGKCRALLLRGRAGHFFGVRLHFFFFFMSWICGGNEHIALPSSGLAESGSQFSPCLFLHFNFNF